MINVLKAPRRVWDRTPRTARKVMKRVEEGAAHLPTDAFLWAAVGGLVGTVTLRALGRERDATLVGLLVPTILVLGLYNKLVGILRD